MAAGRIASSAASRWPTAEGEMADCIRSHDWAATPLGPKDRWPQSLKSAIDICLGSSLVSLVWWGPELIQIYNDAARPLMDGNHPMALAAPARDAWSAKWPDIGPLAEQVLSTGRGVTGDTARAGLALDAWPKSAPVFSYGALRDEAGAVAGILVTAIEDSAARESEERFRQFGDTSSDALWIVDAETMKVEYMSPAYEAIWGEPRDRIMADSRRWIELLHPDDREAALQQMPRLLAGERFVSEYRIVRPDGEVRWIHDSGFPIFDASGRVCRVAGIAQDQTQRRCAEQRLLENQDRLRLALEVGRMATLDWDLRSGKVTWNDEHYRMQGYAVDEVQPSYEAWAARVHPDDIEGAQQTLAEAREQHRDYVHELRYLLPDGSIRWCSARGRFFYEGSEAVRMIGVIEDITERMRSEEYQRLLLAELQHRVRNTLSVVRSIARRTAASNDNIDEYTAHFDGRLNAFARTQAAVTRDPAGGVDLGALVAEELIAHGAREDGQVRIGGPKLRLQPKAAETIGLAIHELATNAVKYGALATPAGHVDIRWTIRSQAGDRRLHVDWLEDTGGRAVARPRRRGFGLDMLERTLGYDLGAEVWVDFARTGLKCAIELPLDERIAVA